MKDYGETLEAKVGLVRSRTKSKGNVCVCTLRTYDGTLTPRMEHRLMAARIVALAPTAS